MSWTALFFIVQSGIISGDLKVVAQIPMQSRQSCESFGNKIAEKSTKNVVVFCVSSETGDVEAIPGRGK